MSVQSEEGRIDYANSDHAPKGTRVAESNVVDINPRLGPSKSDAGALGQYRNEMAVKARDIDFSQAPDTSFMQRKIKQLKRQ